MKRISEVGREMLAFQRNLAAEQTKLLLDNTQRDVKLLEGFVADA